MRKLLLTATLLVSATSLMHAASDESIVLSSSGERFNLSPVAGDGDCAFTAIGKSRAEVVEALKAAVETHDAAYKGFSERRNSMEALVASLSPGSSPAEAEAVLAQVEDFIASSRSLYPEDLDTMSPSILALSALRELESGIGAFTPEEFVIAQSALQSRINNMYYERYESFQTALREELQESGISSTVLTTREGMLRGIEEVFSKNAGRTSWLPMGLVFGINDHLRLNLAVWSSRDEPAGQVRLYQFAAPVGNIWDPSVVHVRWNGGHFDILNPVR